MEKLKEEKKIEKAEPKLNSRLVRVGLSAGTLVAIALCIWVGGVILNNALANGFRSTGSAELTARSLSTSLPIQTLQAIQTNTASPTETSIPPTPTLGIGSTKVGKDGM